MIYSRYPVLFLLVPSQSGTNPWRSNLYTATAAAVKSHCSASATVPNKAEVLVEQRLGTLADRYSRQSRPYHFSLFKKALVSILLSLQRPQRPQHRTPLSTLQSTHQTHILIQSKQHLQPSSHVPTPRAPRMEEGIATCHKIDRLVGVGVLVGRMGRATAGSRTNINGRAKSTSTRGTWLTRPLRFPYFLLHQPLYRLIHARYSDSPTKSGFKPPPPANEGDDRESLKGTVEGLPPNTRDWSNGELSTYLKAALRAQSANRPGGCPQYISTYACSLYINIKSTGVHLPPRLVLDITQWVREQGMEGRSFMRLGENELEGWVVDL